MATVEEGRMGRGEFLAKSAAGGALLVGAGLATGAAPAAAATKAKTAKPKGYAIGDVAADIEGHDQYGKTGRLRSLRGRWVLIDLCPWWCHPCILSARNHRAFQRYLTSQDVKLEVFSVVVDNEDESDP